jgi:uncharacterized protein YndB with AHSA1/START domain
MAKKASRSLRFRRSVGAPPAEVYRALTHPTALRDWLAAAADCAPRVGGHLLLSWRSGYWAAGQFTALEPAKVLAFSWTGKDEPSTTRVRVSLRASHGGTALTLTHSGLGAGSRWKRAEAQIRQVWQEGLDNLQSVLETGVDLRAARTPRMGISMGEFDTDIAERLGVPVQRGIRLEGAVEGSGAAEAGLRKDDVLVRLGSRPVGDFTALVKALDGRQAGDSVAVVYYRGADKHLAQMTLSRQPPPPEWPASGPALAEAARGLYASFLADLSRRLEGVSEAEAEVRPAPGEWSIKELVAHFIACERDLQSWLADMLRDNTVGDSLEFRPNVDPRLAAIVARFGSLPALMHELRCSADETVALLEMLPPEFISRRHMYQRVARWILTIVPIRLRDEHGEQLAATLHAARK